MLRQFLECYIRRSPRWVDKRVVWLVNHAWKNVRFYQDRMKDCRITPDDIQSLKDFVERFPQTHASEYRSIQQSKGSSYLIDKNLPIADLIESRSSGSSGIPISIYMTPTEKKYNDARALWHLIKAGLRPWHRALAVLPPDKMSNSKHLLQRLGFFQRKVVHYLMPVEEIVNIIDREQINVIYGQKSFIRLIADYYNRVGKTPPVLDLLIPGAERVDEYDRQFFKEVFSLKLLREFYGSTETSLIASRHDADYQIDYNACFFSLSNPQVQDQFTTGSILVTSLFNVAQPALNIELGDQVTVRNYDKLCELKANIVSIEGRNNDYLILNDGNRVSGATFYAALEYFPFMRQFRIVQKRLGYCDILLRLSDVSDENRLLVEAAVASVLQDRIEYKIDYVDEIPADPNGKTKILISQVTG